MPVEQEAGARDLVVSMSPSARLTYSVGGTLKFELPTSEVGSEEVYVRMLSLCGKHTRTCRCKCVQPSASYSVVCVHSQDVYQYEAGCGAEADYSLHWATVVDC